MPDQQSDYVCRKCQEPVEKGAERCPHCSYKAWGPRFTSGPRVRLYKMGKWLFFLTIIGIPIGLWYRKKERRAELDREFGVAEPIDD